MTMEGGEKPTIGDVLLREKLISPAQLQRLHEARKDSTRSLGQLVVDMKMVPERARVAVLSRDFGFEVMDLLKVRIDPDVAGVIPAPIQQAQRIVPLRREGRDTLVIAMEDPSDDVLLDFVRHQLKTALKPMIALSEDLDTLLKGPEAVEALRRRAERERKKTAPPSLFSRIFRKVVLPLLYIGPLPLFFALVKYNHEFQQWIYDSTNSFFDIGIYAGLGWALWAILLFEIEGIFFGKKKDDEEE